MKMIVAVALALVAIAIAAPVENDVPVEIEAYDNEQKPDGGYSFRFKSTDGNQREEDGEVKEVVDEEKKTQRVVVVRGSYSYVNPDGDVETINYFADENGYRAEGPSVPKVVSRR